MNRVFLSGSVATAPKRVNERIVTFVMAVYDRYSAKDKRYVTDFIVVQARGKLADFVEKNLEQGQELEIIGKIKTKRTERRVYQNIVCTEVRPMHKSLKKLLSQNSVQSTSKKNKKSE